MKPILIYFVICTFFLACQQPKPAQLEETDVSQAQMDEVQKNTRLFTEESVQKPYSNRDSFLSLNLYLANGAISPDSTYTELVYGKLPKAPKSGSFQIVTRDFEGKAIGSIFTDNFFRFRTCDDGVGQEGNIQKGWLQTHIPFDSRLGNIEFVDNNKTVQKLDMKQVILNNRRRFNKRQ